MLSNPTKIILESRRSQDRYDRYPHWPGRSPVSRFYRQNRLPASAHSRCLRWTPGVRLSSAGAGRGWACNPGKCRGVNNDHQDEFLDLNIGNFDDHMEFASVLIKWLFFFNQFTLKGDHLTCEEFAIAPDLALSKEISFFEICEE